MIPTRYNRMGVDYHSNTKWEINHGSGLLDIFINNADNLFWTFSDGTTSTVSRPKKTVTAGTTIVTCNNFRKNNIQVYIFSTSTANFEQSISLKSLPDLRNFLFVEKINVLTGSVTDLPRITSTLYLANSNNISGSVADLPRVTGSLSLINSSGISGSVADLPRVTSTLYLSSVSGITGSIADLPRVTGSLYLVSLPVITGSVADIPRIANTLYLVNIANMDGSVAYLPNNIAEKICFSCSKITGSLQIINTNNPIYFYANALVSAYEYDQTIANCVSAGGLNKTLYISSRRTSASDADKAILISRGWTVNDSQI